MKQDSTIIHEAIRKYRKSLYSIITKSEKHNNLNLDKAEQKMKEIYNKALEEFYKENKDVVYCKECNFKETLNECLEAINVMIFGCKNNCGVNLGYDFSIERAKQNKHLLLLY